MAKLATKPIVRDANTDILDAVKVGGDRWSKESMKSPASARKALVKLGILTSTGKLTKRYK